MVGLKFSPSPKGEGLFPYLCRKNGTNEKTGFYIIKGQVLKICLIRILRGIREAIDHIIIVLKIMLREFIG